MMSASHESVRGLLTQSACEAIARRLKMPVRHRESGFRQTMGKEEHV
ncbi:hypothetical protein [Lonsdalea britannica]|nr:hypothetical protein [Lonsdalea britannica]